VAFAAALERLYATLNTLCPTRLVIQASPYIKQNLQWELRMKPFSCLTHFTCPPSPPAAPATSTPPDTEHTREILLEAQKLLEEAKTGFVAWLQTPVSSSIEHAVAVGTLAREEQWKKEIKSEMRSVVSTGIVVAKVLRIVDERLVEDKKVLDEGEKEHRAGAGAKKIAWHVEEVDDAGVRRGGGPGCWVVPVVEV